MAQREKDEAELLCVIAGDGPPAPLCSGQEKRRSDPIRPAEGMVLPVPAAAPAAATTAREVKRCAGCRKRVGLMGFRCRCGEVFCGEHRYSERHVCSYDYKAAGRETIARENPLVRAAKIVRV